MIALVLALLPQAVPSNPVLEGIAAQGGESLVSLSEYERVLKRVQSQKPPANRDEEERQRAQILRELLMMRLEEQKGADLGLDPDQIGRISKANLAEEREKEGLDAYLADLRQQGKDALSEETSRRNQVLRYMWEQSAQGRSFAGKRATRDQGIRPGELRALFAENREKLAPVTVQLRWLIVASAAVGGPEAAKASCEDARQRVLAGEDFALIIEERGAEFRESRGLTPFVPPRSLRDAALVQFAEKAEVTDLSEVLPLTNPKTGAQDPNLGYQLVELHERRTPPEPEFASLEVQRLLRRYFLEQRSDLVLGREREQLQRESYAWVNPLLGSADPAPGPRP